MKLRHLFTSILMLILVGCETATEPSTLGSVRLSITLNDVGTLAKASTIELQTLYLEMTKGATTIEDTIPLSGNSEVLVSQSYVDMSEGIWALKVESRDGNSEVIHADSTEFTVIADFLVDVNLALASKYSMLIANFLGISDVVYRCELMVDDVMVADTTFPTRDELDFNLSLDYDYLVTGETHTIKLDAYGAYEGNEYLFYTADTTVDIVAGVDQTYELDLQWIGPYGGLNGNTSINLTIGNIANIIMNGKFPLPGDVLLDIDGNKYRSVLIGTQMWMAENLRVTHYRNGDLIPFVSDNQDWVALSSGALCYLENDSTSNAKTFGGLYNWYAVNDPRIISPEGWHIPSDDEVTILLNNLGGSELAGGAMKMTGTEYWADPNVGATNSSLFNAMPVGSRNFSSGNYEDFRTRSYSWTSTEEDADNARFLLLLDYTPLAIQNSFWKKNGFSIRCVKD